MKAWNFPLLFSYLRSPGQNTGIFLSAMIQKHHLCTNTCITCQMHDNPDHNHLQQKHLALNLMSLFSVISLVTGLLIQLYMEIFDLVFTSYSFLSSVVSLVTVLPTQPTGASPTTPGPVAQNPHYFLLPQESEPVQEATQWRPEVPQSVRDGEQRHVVYAVQVEEGLYEIHGMSVGIVVLTNSHSV